MEERPFQFTLRGLMWITLWFAAWLACWYYACDTSPGSLPNDVRDLFAMFGIAGFFVPYVVLRARQNPKAFRFSVVILLIWLIGVVIITL